MNTEITSIVKDLAQPLAEEKGLFLVDVELKSHQGNELWVYLDGEDRGVNLDECAEISQELGFLIEAHELTDKKYRLNISSPGLSRPLTDKRQYAKNIGRSAKVRYRTEDESVNKITGTLEKVTADHILIIDEEPKEHKSYEIPYDSIIELKIVPTL